MELNKENMRKIRELILFTALLIVVLWKYEEVLEVPSSSHMHRRGGKRSFMETRRLSN